MDSSSSEQEADFTPTPVATPDIHAQSPHRQHPGASPPRVFRSRHASSTRSDGPRPIESIHVGDLVLSQSTTTGELEFHPVVAVHLNKPQPTLAAHGSNGESIVATGIHRFWKAGNGWTMARDLKAGDRLRIVGGVAAIESISSDATQPVYNLDVAENRNFCVGKAGLLVHDFSFVQPVLVTL